MKTKVLKILFALAIFSNLGTFAWGLHDGKKNRMTHAESQKTCLEQQNAREVAAKNNDGDLDGYFQ